MPSIGDVFLAIRGDTKQLEADTVKGAQAAGNKAGDIFGAAFSGKAGSQLLKVGGLVTAGLAGGLAKLDTSARQYQATVGASVAETERAKAAALGLFKVNTAGFDEILGLMAKLRTDQGLTEEQTNRLAQSYLTWAKVAGGSAADAAKSFDDVLDGWNLTAEDAVGVMDKLVASNQKFGGSLQARVQDLAALAPALKGLGLTIDDAIALENAFESAGLDAGQAQRALTKAIGELKPGQNFNDLIQQVSAIEDPTLRAQKAIELFGAKGAGLANVFKPGTQSLAEFGVTADESAGKVTAAGAAIDSSVPKQFELFLRNLGGTLMELAAPAGPVLLTAASMAQLAAGLGGPLAAGLKAATGEVTLFSAALKTIPLVLIGLAVVDLIQRIGQLGTTLDQFSSNEVTKTKAAMKTLENQFGVNAQSSGTLGDAYRTLQARLAVLTGEVEEGTSAAEDYYDRANESTRATNVAAVASKAHAATVRQATKAIDTFTTYTDLGTSALDDLAAASYGAGKGADENSTALSAEAAWLNKAAFYAAVLARNLNALSSSESAANAAVDRRLRQAGEAPGAGINTSNLRGGPAVQPFTTTFTPVDPRGPGGGKGGGGSKTSKADTEAQTAALDKLKAANDRVKAAFDAAFDLHHTKALKAIDDTLQLARTAHTAALQRIADELAVQRAANAAPVTAAEKAQQAIEDERRLRDLNEALATAQAGGDPIAIRNAQEALQSEAARRNIAALRETQAAADAQAELNARIATAAEDAKLAAAESAAEKAKAAEDKRYTDQKAAFDDAYAKLAVASEASGKAITLALAAGIIKGTPAVIAAFKKLVDEAAKLLPHSPAEKGPFSGDGSPYARGLATVQGFVDGANAALRTARLTGVDRLAAQMSEAPAYAAARVSSGATSPAASPGNSSPTIVVNNPRPEPASRSVPDALKLLSAFGN